MVEIYAYWLCMCESIVSLNNKPLGDNTINQFFLFFRSTEVCMDFHRWDDLPMTSYKTFLAMHGYWLCPITPGLWRHETWPLWFTLVVDGYKFTNKANAIHLMDSLKKHYKVAEDLEGICYCSLALNWDNMAQTVDLSMSGYIDWACNNSSIPHDNDQNICHMHDRSVPMKQKDNMQHHQTCHLFWMQLTTCMSKKSLEFSFSIPGLLIHLTLTTLDTLALQQPRPWKP